MGKSLIRLKGKLIYSSMNMPQKIYFRFLQSTYNGLIKIFFSQKFTNFIRNKVFSKDKNSMKQNSLVAKPISKTSKNTIVSITKIL